MSRVRRVQAVAIVLLLAFGGACGDDDDIHCRADDPRAANDTLTTRVYCFATWGARICMSKFLRLFGVAVGLFLVLYYHLVMLLKAKAASSRANDPAPRWEVELETGWEPYDDDLASKLNAAEASRRSRLVYFCRRTRTGERQRYSIDVKRLVQEHEVTHKKRRVRRITQEVFEHRFQQLLMSDNKVVDTARIARLLGQNMLSYSFYFIPNTRLNPFLISLMMILVDQFGLRILRTRIEHGMFGSEGSEHKGVKKIWELNTIYALPSGSQIRLSFVFVAQLVLFFMYFVWMNQISAEIESKGEPLVWFMGVLIMCTVGSDQSGGYFDIDAWGNMWKGPARPVREVRNTWTIVTVAFRCFWDWLVNGCFRCIFLCTVPVLLSTEGPMDFIKDVMAIVFVSVLDDPPSDQYKFDAQNKLHEHCQKRKVDLGLSDEQITDTLDDEERRSELEELSVEDGAQVMWDFVDQESDCDYGEWAFFKDILRLVCCGCTAQARESPLSDALLA